VHRQFREHFIPVHTVGNVNGLELRRLLTDLRVDLLVSLNCPQKLGPDVLRLPALGCVNVHFGLLPKYRGILPIMYAILNGEREFGVTIHYMDEKLDNGEIIVQGTVPIGPTDTLETLYPQAFELAGDLLCRAFELIESGTAVGRPNPEDLKTYYSYPSSEVARRYRQLARQRRRFRRRDLAAIAATGYDSKSN
jgi:methionyl-tRNA formyltransferase